MRTQIEQTIYCTKCNTKKFINDGLPGEEVEALSGLNAPGAPAPLPCIRQAHPLRLQGGQVGIQVILGDFDLATVDDVDNVVDGDGGLRNVRSDDNLACPLRWPLEDGPLGGRRHQAVHRVDGHGPGQSTMFKN